MFAFFSQITLISQKKSTRKHRNTRPQERAVVEIDFYGDAPALRNEFKVWLASAFFEGSSVSDALIGSGHISTINISSMNEERYEDMTSGLLVVCRASNGMGPVRSCEFPSSSRQGGLPVPI
jgi:hypothetical protein